MLFLLACILFFSIFIETCCIGDVITTVAGSSNENIVGDGGVATSAMLNIPHGVAVDAELSMYIADAFNNRIRLINASTGIISTIAGTGSSGYSGDGGAATSAKLTYPQGVAVDAELNVYIADRGNHRIRLINASTPTFSCFFFVCC